MRKKKLCRSHGVAPSATATINRPAVRITQRKHSISRAWILITQTHETGLLRRMVRSRSRSTKR